METQARIQLDETEQKLARLLLDAAAFNSPKKPSELRFTGGWVRDKLLGIGSHDIDIAIDNMKGEPFAIKMFEYLDIPGNAEKYGLLNEIHKLHKIKENPEKSKHLETVTIKLFGLDLDFVHLRKETYTEETGRVPVVEFGTPEEDALRRDATINAMFYNLQTELVEDFTKRGMDDLAHKFIKTPLEAYQTFKDDPLRILRLIRFASRFNYTIDDEAMVAMKNETIKEALKLKISRERVLTELEKMLRGPDPLLALRIIDEAGLYDTIFTDPTQKLQFSPDAKSWQPAYSLLSQILPSNNGSVLSDILFPDAEHQYTAWLMTAFVPWVDAPISGGKKKTPLGVLVAREGIKAPLKICDLVDASIRHSADITTMKSSVAQRSRGMKNNEDGSCTRDVLGMAMRRWGSTWRGQFVYAIMLEVAQTKGEHDAILRDWIAFLQQIKDDDLLDVCDKKPLLTGTELATALNTKPGPWMKEALDVVMAWQLRNPKSVNKEEAIEAVRNNQGELTAVLIRHFLQLTIRPLFAKTQTQLNVTAQGRKVTNDGLQLRRSLDFNDDDDDESKKPWKGEQHSSVLKLLTWSVSSLNETLAEQNWPLLLPPILALLDDTEIPFKVLGCKLLAQLLSFTSPTLLKRTGLGDVFHDAIEPCLSYLPGLTPEDDSITLLNAAYPAILTLGRIRFLASIPKSYNPEHVKYLTALLHSHILSSISHVSDSYPKLTSILLYHMRQLINDLATDTISELPHIIPVLSSIMTTPFVAAEPVALLSAVKTMKTVITNAWPRMWFWHGEILKGLTAGWIAMSEEKERWESIAEKKGDAYASDILQQTDVVCKELRLTTETLLAALGATNQTPMDDGGGPPQVDISSLTTQLTQAHTRLEGLFARELTASET